MENPLWTERGSFGTSSTCICSALLASGRQTSSAAFGP